MRPAVTHAPDVAGMVMARLFGADADVDRNASRAQPRMPRTRDFGIRVFQRRDDAGNTPRDDGVGTGRRFSVVRAGLQRHVKRRAPRRLAGATQRLDLRMRPTPRLRPTAADNDAVLDDYRTDRRIGPGAAEPAPAKRERQRHEAGILLQGVRRRAHLRAISAASSPDNSASAVSKSLASRKLR